MTDVNKLMTEGKSLEYVLEAVKAEYAAKEARAAAQKKADEEREAKARALKIEASRTKLLKAMEEYAIVLTGDADVACGGMLVKVLEKELKDAEKHIQVIADLKGKGFEANKCDCKGNCNCRDEDDAAIEAFLDLLGV